MGENPSIASIDPPEGSKHAEACGTFFPFARRALLEEFPYHFSMKRVQLAQVTAETTNWSYAYTVPSDYIRALNVYALDATDDAIIPKIEPSYDVYPEGKYVQDDAAQPYVIEALADNTRVIYTNQEDAVLHYVYDVLDTSKFSPTFDMAISYMMASFLCGDVIGGREGSSMAASMKQMAQSVSADAQVLSANQSKERIDHYPAWITDR